MKASTVKTHFVAGLLALVPVMITLYIVVAAFNFLQGTIGKHIDTVLQPYLPVHVRGAGVLVSLIIVILVGFLVSTVIGNRLFRYGERLLTKVPIAKEIYPSAKQMIEFFMAPKEQSFRSVVAIPFPSEGYYMIGFQTGDPPPQFTVVSAEPLVTVFVPHSPSPISGFTVVLPASHVIPLDMSAEEALKFIVSLGVLASENQKSDQSSLALTRQDADR